MLADGARLQALVVRIGIGGAVVQLAQRIDFATPVTLCLTASGRELELAGHTRWYSHDGVGIQFAQLSALQTASLAGLVKPEAQLGAG